MGRYQQQSLFFEDDNGDDNIPEEWVKEWEEKKREKQAAPEPRALAEDTAMEPCLAQEPLPFYDGSLCEQNPADGQPGPGSLTVPDSISLSVGEASSSFPGQSEPEPAGDAADVWDADTPPGERKTAKKTFPSAYACPLCTPFFLFGRKIADKSPSGKELVLRKGVSCENGRIFLIGSNRTWQIHVTAGTTVSVQGVREEDIDRTEPGVHVTTEETELMDELKKCIRRMRDIKETLGLSKEEVNALIRASAPTNGVVPAKIMRKEG